MRVLIRADGHPSLGGGHVMRQLALAERLMALGATVRFASPHLDPSLEALIAERGLSVDLYEARSGSREDAQRLYQLSTALAATWIVLDHYELDTEFARAVQAGGARVLVVDDYLNRSSYHGDLLLNQSVSASQGADYRDRGFTGELLLGPEYALLRREFAEPSRSPRPTPATARRLLVSMGSADSAGATERALSAIQRLDAPDLVVDVVIGAANPRGASLRAEYRDPRIVWHEPAHAMASLMCAADFALGAAGVTSLELSCLGVPAMLMVVADNQAMLARSTEEAGAAIDLGWYEALSPSALAQQIDALRMNPERRKEMAEAGRRRVDGRGVDRVIEAMKRVGSRWAR